MSLMLFKKFTLLIILFFNLNGIAQTYSAKVKIDSLCAFINSKDTQALRIKVKSRKIDIVEWQRVYVDTLQNKTLKVFTREEKSNISYKYYFFQQKLIKVEVNTYSKANIVDSSSLYFNNKTILPFTKNKPSNQKVLILLKRAKAFFRICDIYI